MRAERAALWSWLCRGEAPRAEAQAEGLLAAAVEQGLAGPFHRAISARELEWPDTLRQRLRDACRVGLARGAAQLGLAGRVLKLFQDHDQRALPLKGCAVAESLYESLTDRAMVDIDILALDDWAAARRVLLDQGFVEVSRADHAWGFRDPLTGEIVELHRSLTSCPGLFPLDADGLWARHRPEAGLVPRRPSNEDLLVQLSLHATFQHGLVLSFGKFLDFRRLLERSPPDPGRLLDAAARAQALPAVGAALEAARMLVGAPVPEPLRRVLASAAPAGFGRWLSVRLRDPLDLVGPGPVPLARVRWEMLAGRRGELLQRTLLPDPRGRGERLGSVAARAGRRAAKLITRWAHP